MARFDDNWDVIIDYTESKEDLCEFRGSKYVQAVVGESYKQCECFLKAGYKVLYTGTPCQISGLKHFLRKEYDDLLTLDFVCHGVPSPKVWRRYLSEITNPSFINSQCAHSRYRGGDFSFFTDYSKDESILTLSSTTRKNAYMTAFLKDLILRPSCYSCVVKKCSSKSDMTIADFWGIWDLKPELFDDKGTSMILVHTDRAKEYILSEELELQETSYEVINKYNQALLRSTKPHNNRDLFWSNLDKVKSINKLVSKCCGPKGLLAIKVNLMKLLSIFDTCKVVGIQNVSSYSKFDILSISFRNKKNSWRQYEFVIKLKGFKE